MNPHSSAGELGVDQRSSADAYLEVLVADGDWVDAEFDAIIRAS